MTCRRSLLRASLPCWEVVSDERGRVGAHCTPVLGAGGWFVRVSGEVEVMVDVVSARPGEVREWVLLGLVQGSLMLGDSVTAERWNEFVGMASRE